MRRGAWSRRRSSRPAHWSRPSAMGRRTHGVAAMRSGRCGQGLAGLLEAQAQPALGGARAGRRTRARSPRRTVPCRTRAGPPRAAGPAAPPRPPARGRARRGARPRRSGPSSLPGRASSRYPSRSTAERAAVCERIAVHGAAAGHHRHVARPGSRERDRTSVGSRQSARNTSCTTSSAAAGSPSTRTALENARARCVSYARENSLERSCPITQHDCSVFSIQTV